MPTYYSIFTTVGLARLAEAQASGIPLVFTEVAVGDGGGSPITPLAAMTALVNETARVSVNSVDIQPDAPTTVRVEGLIPAATGGFTIREAGLFNADGELIAIASYPPIYKPDPGDGLAVEEYVRVLLVYTEVSAIALTVDTSAIVATRLYVDKIREQLEAVIVDDEFVGTQLDLGKWKSTSGDASVIADLAAGGMGVLKLEADAGNPTQQVNTLEFPIGLGDFRLKFQLRYSVDNTSGVFTVGLIGTGGDIAIRSTNSANWILLRTGASDEDLGVAPSSSHQLIIIERVNGLLRVTIDGAVVFAEADSVDISAAVTMMAQKTASDCTLLVDRMQLTSGTPFSLGATELQSEHKESGFITVAAPGAGLVYDVAFDEAFEFATGANGYEFNVTISYTSDPYTFVEWWVVNPTVNGFSIVLSDDTFTGEIRWSAHR